MNPLALLAALFLPPLGVFLVRGISPSFWLSVVLTVFGFVPGLIFALFVVLTDKPATALHRAATPQGHA